MFPWQRIPGLRCYRLREPRMSKSDPFRVRCVSQTSAAASSPSAGTWQGEERAWDKNKRNLPLDEVLKGKRRLIKYHIPQKRTSKIHFYFQTLISTCASLSSLLLALIYHNVILRTRGGRGGCLDDSMRNYRKSHLSNAVFQSGYGWC